MNNRQDQARFFAENIDRILAGERPEFSPLMEEDLRTALEFTVRMAEMEPRLRPGFEAALQEKLRRQLVELEEKARTRPARNRWSWLRQQLRRQLRRQRRSPVRCLLTAVGCLLSATPAFAAVA